MKNIMWHFGEEGNGKRGFLAQLRHDKKSDPSHSRSSVVSRDCRREVVIVVAARLESLMKYDETE